MRCDAAARARSRTGSHAAPRATCTSRAAARKATRQRWLDRCTRELLSTTRRNLAAQLRVDRTDVDSILRLVRSRLEISIRAALASEGG